MKNETKTANVKNHKTLPSNKICAGYWICFISWWVRLKGQNPLVKANYLLMLLFHLKFISQLHYEQNVHIQFKWKRMSSYNKKYCQFYALVKTTVKSTIMYIQFFHHFHTNLSKTMHSEISSVIFLELLDLHIIVVIKMKVITCTSLVRLSNQKQFPVLFFFLKIFHHKGKQSH